jgi:hypothetical protein
MYKLILAIVMALACAVGSGSHKGSAHHPTTLSGTDTTGTGGDSGGDDGHIHPHG